MPTAGIANRHGTTGAPQQPLLTESAGGDSTSNFYSAQCSLYCVTMLHDYTLYNSDTAVLAQQWRMLFDGNGLVSVTASDVHDWLPNLASPTTGKVTSTHLLYDRARTQAAALEVTVPAGTTGTIAVPVPSARAAVRLNGKTVATAASSTLDGALVTTSDGTSYRYIDGVGAGTWRISVRH